MKRAAIYARFSSERQNESSIDDQVRLCREHIARAGHAEAGVYADYAISGSSLLNRPQARMLLADAQAGRFDVVVTEALDRLSRDQEDTAAMFKRLAFAGVSIVTLAEGEVSELHVGLKGTMNALYLKDLAQRVRRGQSGRALAGSAPAGRSYGYDVVLSGEYDRRGQPIRGGRKINEAEAAVIRRIFAEFISGLSPRVIAAGLNRDGIPSPAGKAWNASTINGNAARGNGILYNPLYVGRLVYNRLRMIKDPQTGKRVSRLNPESAWIVTEVPDLRIVDQETWNRAQKIKSAFKGQRVHKTRRAKHLFTGLVFCGCCGAAYTVKNNDQLACRAHRESGTCTNNRTILVPDIERRVLAGIRDRLLSGAAIDQFVQAYQAERKRLRQESSRRRADATGRLPIVRRQIDHLVSAIADGTPVTSSMKEKLLTLEREREDLEGLVAESPDDPPVLIGPGALASYRRRIDDLSAALAATDPARRAEAAAILRTMIGRVEIHPRNGRGETDVVVTGLISELLNLPHRRAGKVNSAVMMVAAEGFEPPTKGL